MHDVNIRIYLKGKLLNIKEENKSDYYEKTRLKKYKTSWFLDGLCKYLIRLK